ncbi:uncharacterized SAM-binding protein YcdF (DUF218 family) [Pedobacter psychrotolerans]|uniref:Uncharacterized SAM-binding protein YcdF (DUF218 family) n=1 Tax=Pedobacter psychrotolerans TaxID=1843235 RepID=A0A4V6NN52_9SPHI|nr:uncharacterized SAM-binding protein YcdF (DUF218 family) [Pedobacter psychrotolerans]
MIFIFSKLFIFFLRPLVWVFAILIFSCFAKKRKRQLLITGIVLFFFFSNNFIVGKVSNIYEAAYPKKQNYNVGIVLGGYSSYNKRINQIALGASGDRLFQALRLFKSGNIQKILISSGSANLLDTTVKEADLTLGFLKQMNIPDSAILIENRSRNTVENAKYSLALIKKYQPNAKILVITSAWHIPRTKLIFNKLSDNKIDYYPTNFIGKTDYDLPDFIIPDAAAFSNWDILLKEWVGCAVDYARS